MIITSDNYAPIAHINKEKSETMSTIGGYFDGLTFLLLFFIMLCPSIILSKCNVNEREFLLLRLSYKDNMYGLC